MYTQSIHWNTYSFELWKGNHDVYIKYMSLTGPIKFIYTQYTPQFMLLTDWPIIYTISIHLWMSSMEAICDVYRKYTAKPWLSTDVYSKYTPPWIGKLKFSIMYIWCILTLGEKTDLTWDKCSPNEVQIWYLSHLSVFDLKTNMTFVLRINRIIVHLLLSVIVDKCDVNLS